MGEVGGRVQELAGERAGSEEGGGGVRRSADGGDQLQAAELRQALTLLILKR